MYWPLHKRIIRRVKFWLCPHWAKHQFGHGTYKCPWCGGVNNYFHHVGWKIYWHPTDTWRKGPREYKWPI